MSNILDIYLFKSYSDIRMTVIVHSMLLIYKDYRTCS